jgi:hypothetical protein
MRAFAAIMLVTMAVSVPNAFAQGGSTGGTLGNIDKSISGTREEPKPSTPRERHTARASPSTEKTAGINLSGAWRGPSGGTEIHQQGGQLVFRNEFGVVVHGQWIDSSTVVAVEWGVQGKVSNNGRSIAWSNGTQWAR